MSKTLLITDFLIKAGVKPSSQRIAVMKYLAGSKSHPTASEIYDALRPEHPTLSRTTVYNTLKLFVETGCSRCLSVDSVNARFDAAIHPHAHFMCRHCHSVTDIEMPLPELDMEGFESDTTDLYFTGTCASCKNKKTTHKQ